MEDPRPELDRPVDREYARRWWPGPRVGSWPDALQMAAPVAAAALLTACGAGLALWVDARGRGSWEAPVVIGLGLLTVLFYGWVIYSAVHPLPTVRPSGPDDATDSPEQPGPGSGAVSAP